MNWSGFISETQLLEAEQDKEPVKDDLDELQMDEPPAGEPPAGFEEDARESYVTKFRQIGRSAPFVRTSMEAQWIDPVYTCRITPHVISHQPASSMTCGTAKCSVRLISWSSAIRSVSPPPIRAGGK